MTDRYLALATAVEQQAREAAPLIPEPAAPPAPAPAEPVLVLEAEAGQVPAPASEPAPALEVMPGLELPPLPAPAPVLEDVPAPAPALLLDGAVAPVPEPAARAAPPQAPVPGPGPAPEVSVYLGEKLLATFSLATGELTIGRNPGNDILIENVGVSRRHAVIRWAGGQAVVEDLGSANGTFVNGLRVTRQPLKDGDEILVLKHRLLFRQPKERSSVKAEPLVDVGQTTMYIERGAIPQAVGSKSETAAKLRPRLILPDLKKVALEEGQEIVLGSSSECRIQLSGMFVAKAHARIFSDKEGQFKIQHLAGLAGTRVNGEKITERVLRHGDEIEIGKQKLLFRIER
jgi:pSer/pThr/pTyr-binding forkhead associated (FHA) protein